jgi:hypothetical protein
MGDSIAVLLVNNLLTSILLLLTYQRYAGLHHDELAPVSNSHHDWMQLSVTTFSAMDTMLVMGLKVLYILLIYCRIVLEILS